MVQIRFGGPLGDVLDGTSHITVRPRMMGEAQIIGNDLNAVALEMGGQEALVSWVQGTIMTHAPQTFATLSAEKGVMKAMSDVPTLVQMITQRVDPELAQIGARLQIGSITINLSEEDVNALKAAMAQAAQKKREQAMRPRLPTMMAPGTRVMARWTDGREFGATVRNFNGTHYEIVWDGASESTFVTPDRVRQT
jgi:hypothetical protein